MSFDGNKYRAGDYTLPTYYHPGAAFQSQAVANCLKNSYFAAQQNSRLVMQCVYPQTVGLPFATQENFTVYNNNWTKIAHCEVFLPLGITHLVCSANYAALSTEGGEVGHKIVATNATSETLENTHTVPIPSSASIGGVFGNRPGLANQNLADFQPMGTSGVELELEKAGSASITLGGLFTIDVYANAFYYDDFLEVNRAQYYRPFFVCVWTETRAE